MGKSMFEGESDNAMLINILSALNEKLNNAKKIKTVEELQKVINDLNSIIGDIKKSIANY